MSVAQARVAGYTREVVKPLLDPEDLANDIQGQHVAFFAATLRYFGCLSGHAKVEALLESMKVWSEGNGYDFKAALLHALLNDEQFEAIRMAADLIVPSCGERAITASKTLLEMVPAPEWSHEPPTEQGLYWHWTGDLDSVPIPLGVMYSGVTHKCFVPPGQYGIRLATDCDKWGGYWQKAHVPAMDESLGFHGSEA
jgi:hypothetical protein